MASIAPKEERLKINVDLARKDFPGHRFAVNDDGDIAVWIEAVSRFVLYAEFDAKHDAWLWHDGPEWRALNGKETHRTKPWREVADEQAV